MSRQRHHVWLIGGILALAAIIYSCGIHEMFLYGHSGWCGARRAVAGTNFVRYGFVETGFGPVENFGSTSSHGFKHYWHHPVGIHLLVGASFSALGIGEWQTRIVPALLMLASLMIFYLLARRWWQGAGLWAGLIFFVTTPMLGYYGPFVNQEPLVLLACLAAVWSYLCWQETQHMAWLLMTGLVACLAAWSDWPWFVFAFGLALCVFPKAIRQRQARLWLVVFCLAVLVGLSATVAHLVSLQDAKGAMEAFKNLAEFRSGGDKKTLVGVFQKMAPRWVELFTPSLLFAGLAWLPILLIDAKHKRLKLHHGVAMSFLITAVIWTMIFRQGAHIHEYWPFFAVVYFVMASADIIERLATVLIRHAQGRVLHMAAKGLIVAIVCLQATTGVAGVIRRHTHPDINTKEGDGYRFRHAVLARWLQQHTEAHERIAFHDKVISSKFQIGFYTGRHHSRQIIHGSRRTFRPVKGHAVAVADLRELPQQVQASILSDAVEHHPVTVLDDFLVLDLRKEITEPQVKWLRIEQTEASLWHWWFGSMVYGPYELKHDMLLEAQLLLATGHPLEALERYAQTPPFPDDLRHRVADRNLAKAGGLQPPSSESWFESLPDPGEDAPIPEMPVSFGQDIRLMGYRLTQRFKHGYTFEGVFKSTTDIGRPWRPFFDRHSAETDAKKKKTALIARIIPDSEVWDEDMLFYQRVYVPLNPRHPEAELRFGFWRSKGRNKAGKEHLASHKDRALLLKLEAKPSLTDYPWFLEWLDWNIAKEDS